MFPAAFIKAHFPLSSLQNVLRELEQKKPQLDDLVKTAENLRESPIKQQIPAKGERGHVCVRVTVSFIRGLPGGRLMGGIRKEGK